MKVELDDVINFLKEAVLGDLEEYGAYLFLYLGDEAEPMFDVNEFKAQFNKWLKEKAKK